MLLLLWVFSLLFLLGTSQWIQWSGPWSSRIPAKYSGVHRRTIESRSERNRTSDGNEQGSVSERHVIRWSTAHCRHTADEITIRGQATLEWGDQIRFLARPLVRVVGKLAAFMAVGFGAVWALTFPGNEWLALRAHPLMSLGRFVVDIWPFYLGGLAFTVLILVGRVVVTFLRFPQANRQLTYEVNANGILTRDAADFSSRVPWTSILRMRNTPRILFLQTSARLVVREPCYGALSRPRIAIRSCAGRNVQTGKRRLD